MKLAQILSVLAVLSLAAFAFERAKRFATKAESLSVQNETLKASLAVQNAALQKLRVDAENYKKTAAKREREIVANVEAALPQTPPLSCVETVDAAIRALEGAR